MHANNWEGWEGFKIQVDRVKNPVKPSEGRF